MTWGGLRGAVGFSLATVLKTGLWYRELFLTTALIMVLFTVFFQGGTIKLFVRFLKIDLEQEKGNVIGVEIHEKVMDDISHGVTAILGNLTASGRLANMVRNWDERLKSLFLHEGVKIDLMRKFEKISVHDHFVNLYAPRLIVQNCEAGGNKGVAIENDEGSEHIHILRHGMKNRHWSKLSSNYKEAGGLMRTKNILSELERRNKNSKKMEMEALNMGLDPVTEEGANGDEISDETINRLKAHYKKVQSRKTTLKLEPASPQ